MTADPDPETKMMTAVCRNCGEVLCKRPYGPWVHDMSGGTICVIAGDE